MARRIYTETVKKWLIGIGASGGTIIGSIFLYLALTGAIEITGYSGDMVCAGTIEDPCYAYINFTANEDIFIYPIDYDPWGRNTPFEFDPAIKSWILQRSWGSGWRTIPLNKSCTGTWCGLSNKDDKRVFSIAFREGRSYQIRIIGYKYNPTDIIKWGAFDEIDPKWLGVEEKKLKTSYTYSTKTVCNDNNICVKSLYSGTMFGYEDNKWKELKDLKSFKDSTNIKCIVDEDGINPVECLDYNLTFIKLNLNSNTKRNIPLKILTSNKTLKKEENIEFGIDLKPKEFLIKVDYGDIIEFGENSTTVQLQDNVTEILEDTFESLSAPDTNYGTSNYLRMSNESQSNNIYRTFIKFDISSVSGKSIADSQLCLYVKNCYYSSGNMYTYVYEVDNQSWIETTLTWNNPVGGVGSLIDSLNKYSDGAWYCYNVTSWVDTEISNSHTNVSFKINATGLPDGLYYIAYSKDYTTNITLRPYLNITYADPDIDMNMSLNDLYINRTYEWGTKAKINISSNVTGSYSTNFYVNNELRNTFSTLPHVFNYTVNDTRYTKNNNSESEFNFTGDNTTYVNMDNETDLISAHLNLTGFDSSGYPENITIDSANDGNIDAILKGELRGSNLYVDNFVYSNNIYTAKNLSYSTAGSKTIYLNVSSDGNFKDNLTFEISGFDINPESFNFEDEFLNNSYINSSLSENVDFPTTVYDGFERNTTNNYDIDKTLGTTTWDSLYLTSGTYDNDYIYVYSNLDSNSDSTTYISKASLTTENFDVKNYKNIKFRFYEHSYLTGAWGTNKRLYQIFLYDENSSKFIWGDTIINTAETIEKNATWELRKGDNNYTWSLYEDSTFKTTVDCSSLNSSEDWQVKFIYETRIKSAQPAHSILEIHLYELNTSGVSLITNRTSDTYNTTLEGNVTSTLLNTFTNNITSAILKSNYETPTNTSVTFYLSADNKVNWDEVVVGEEQIFTTKGKNLFWKAILNTTNVNNTPRINLVEVNVIPGAAENITIDLGDDGSNLWEYNGTLNASTSPQTVSMNITDLENYISDNCECFTCLIPILISVESGGMIEVNTLNLTYKMNPIDLNYTLLDSKNGTIGFNVSFDNGIIQIDDIDIHYKGDGNVNISACYSNYCDNKTITVRYSKFNLSLPSNVDYWEVFPSSNTQKNVTPYGQSSSVPIWNVTSMSNYNLSLSVWVNESLNSCLNISFSNHSNRTGEILINTTPNKVYSNLTSKSHFGLWNWIDLYNCSARFYLPYFSFSAICSDCVRSEEWWLANLIEG